MILFSLVLCIISGILSLDGICLDALLERACELNVLAYLEVFWSLPVVLPSDSKFNVSIATASSSLASPGSDVALSGSFEIPFAFRLLITRHTPMRHGRASHLR